MRRVDEPVRSPCEGLKQVTGSVEAGARSARGLRVRPVSEFAALARDPVDPPAAPLAVEHEGDENVLCGVLRPHEIRRHLPRPGHHRPVGVVVSGLGYEGGSLLAELRQFAAVRTSALSSPPAKELVTT